MPTLISSFLALTRLANVESGSGQMIHQPTFPCEKAIWFSKWLARTDPKTHYLRLALVNEEKMGGISKPCA